jgi:ferrous iron transport protein B
MGTIYNIEADAAEGGSLSLQERLRSDRDHLTGEKTFTTLTAVCVMLYYVLAMQCLSTVAVMRRETGGWKWPLVQLGYMTALAYIVVLVTYQAGSALGWG